MRRTRTELALLALVGGLGGCPALGSRAVDRLSDRDGDGVPSLAYGGRDCDDRDPRVHPEAPEICDGLDNDCDGLQNEDDPDARGVEWYRDADGDGAGDEASLVRTCEDLGSLGGAWVRPGGPLDCDDGDPEQHPTQGWRIDGDGDGFPSGVGAPRIQCERPENFVPVVWLPADDPDAEPVEDESRWDCRDFDATVFPGALEVCNQVDDDCDLAVDDDDDGLQALTVFEDADGDQFGGGDPVQTCAPTERQVRVGGDCDDEDPAENPLTPEIPYDGLDQNCDLADLVDVDGDRHDAVEVGGEDCDDRAPWTHPRASEVCDGVDNDCDGSWDPSQEVGATWVEAAESIDPGSPNVRRFTDLSTLLQSGGMGLVGLFDAPATGTLWLCDDAERSGTVTAVGALEVRVPTGHTTTFGTWAVPATLVGSDLDVRDLHVRGSITTYNGRATLERVTLEGLLTVAQGTVTVRDTALRGTQASEYAADLQLAGAGALERVVVTGLPVRVDGADAHGLTITDSVFRDVDPGFALQLVDVDGALLDRVRFVDNVEGSILASSTRSVNGTALRFAGGGVDIRFAGSDYHAPEDTPTDVSCLLGSGCDLP